LALRDEVCDREKVRISMIQMVLAATAVKEQAA